MAIQLEASITTYREERQARIEQQQNELIGYEAEPESPKAPTPAWAQDLLKASSPRVTVPERAEMERVESNGVLMRRSTAYEMKYRIGVSTSAL